MKIFFDVDGVLINGYHAKPEHRRRWDADIEKDLGINPEKLQKIFSGWFLDVLHGRSDLEQELGRWLAEEGYTHKARDLIDYWHSNDSVLNEDLWGAVRRLSQNPHLHLYIATNQTHNRADYLWNTLAFKEHFKDIYYSARLGCLKLDGDYFRQIEEELRFDPREEPVLYFDDDPRNIEVSAKRGWNAVLFDTAQDCVNHPAIRALLSA